MSRIAGWVINWYFDHSPMYKRWAEEQDRIVRTNVYYDTVIGQPS